MPQDIDHESAPPPSDHTTLTEVLDAYGVAGYAGDFFAGAGCTVECGACNSVLDASRVSIERLRRLEGASDPADMMAVVATTCPACRTRGTMVLAYGPNASDEETAVWLALGDHRPERQ